MNNRQSLFSYATYWSLFAIIIACYSLIFIFFPTALDDWGYLNAFIQYGTDQDGHHTLLMGMKEAFLYHFRTDNARIGNIIGAFLEIAPKWLTTSISSLCFALSLWLMTVLADIKPNEVIKFIILGFLTVFGLSWHEHFFCHIFAYNYIVILPLFLFAYYIFLYKPHYNSWYASIIGLFIGCWHESYGLSLLGGGLAILILKPEFRTRWRFIMLTFVAVGLAWLIFCPGTLCRIRGSEGKLIAGFSRLPYQWICYTAFISFIVSLSKGKWRRSICYSPLMIASIVSSVGLIYIAIFTSYTRASFPAQVLSVCVCIQAAAIWWPRLMDGKYLRANIIIGVFGIITPIHLIAVVNETIKIRDTADRMYLALWYKGSESHIFAPFRYPSQASCLALSRPDDDIFNQWGANSGFYRFFFNDQEIRIIPIELREYRKDMGMKLDGNNDIYLYKGHIVTSNPNDTLERWKKIIYKHYTDISPVAYAKFKGADGNSFFYFSPKRSTIGRYMGDPIGIDDVQF